MIIKQIVLPIWTLRGCARSIDNFSVAATNEFNRKLGRTNTFLFGCHILVILVISSLDYLSRAKFRFLRQNFDSMRLKCCTFDQIWSQRFVAKAFFLSTMFLFLFFFCLLSLVHRCGRDADDGRWSDLLLAKRR